MTCLKAVKILSVKELITKTHLCFVDWCGDVKIKEISDLP
jgi:hypothetical protein